MDRVTKFFLKGSELGTLSRRQLFQALGLSATAAVTASALPRTLFAAIGAPAQAANKTFPVTTVNHLSYASTDYAKVRDFYVDFFGMRDVWDDGTKCQVDCGPAAAPNSMYITSAQRGAKPTVNHFAFGLPNFWERRTELKDEMIRRGFSGVHEDGEAGWFVNGPSGYVNQPVTVMDPAMFPGAAQPCAEAKSAKCKEAYEKGLKNLASIPKASGKGFAAFYFKYIVLLVPDVEAERNFYTGLFGMKVVSSKKDDVSLRFGQNTLVLRPSDAGAKPSCNAFGFVVENYNEARVKAEANRRGLSAKPNPSGGLLVTDPNGLEIGIGGRG
jgi:catechol 2,3-dioxygenase-like lactoylglutathione lyase family enzyme